MKPKFEFHISDPNNEDVYPLVHRDWLAVADGMGGSGCMKHEVREEYRKCLADILKYVLPEYTEGGSQNESEFRSNVGDDPERFYLAHIFSPCIHDAVNTSARWASRIVMTRFLYYICEKEIDLNNPQEVDALRDFLQKGLKKTADTLSLTVSNPNMSLLPTTFAALRCRPLPDGEYEVHAVWAGDSRCYLLDKDGLAWLSADDENEYKLLTNCFAAEGHTELHCRRYVLKKPFLLFCASDGFFDAYDKYELSVEARLLLDIFEAKDFNELKERLVARYRGNVSDDTSVALAGVGFSEYGELTAMLADRWGRVKKLFEQHCEYARIASLISRPEAHVTGTVCDRFETKFSEIVRRIVEAGYNGQNDPLVTPHWRQLITESKEREEGELRRKLNERKAQLVQKVREEIQNSDYETCFLGAPDFNAPWGKALNAFREADHSRTTARKKLETIIEEDNLLAKEMSALLSDIYKKMDETCASFRDLLQENLAAEGAEREPAEVSKERWERYNEHLSRYRRLKFLVTYECRLLKSKDPGSDEKPIGNDELELSGRILDFRSRKFDCEKRRKDAEITCEKREKERSGALSRLEQYLGAMLESHKTVFTAEFIGNLRMDEAMNGVIDSEELLAAVTEELRTRYAGDRGILDETLEAWKKITDQATCIDDLFAAGKLSDFRLYYKHRDLSDSEEFRLYKEALEQIESEYGRMLRPDGVPQNDRIASPEEQTLAEIPQAPQTPQAPEPQTAEAAVTQEAPEEPAPDETKDAADNGILGTNEES